MGLLDDAIREHLDLKRRRGGDPAEIERLERDALGPVRRGPSPEAVLDLEDDRTAVLGAAAANRDDLDEPLDEGQAGGYHEEPELLPGLPDEELADTGPAAEPRARPSRLRPRSLRERIRGRGSAPMADAFEDEPEDDYRDDLDAPAGADLPGSAGHAVAPGEVDRWAETGEESDVPSPPPPHATESPQSGGASAARSSEAPEPIVFDHLSQPTAEYDVIAEEHAGEAHGGKAKGPDGEDVLEETPDFLQDTPDHDRLWFEQRPPRDFDFDG